MNVVSFHAFACESCGAPHKRLVGRCEQCGTWNTVKRASMEPPSTGYSAFSPSRLRGDEPAGQAGTIPAPAEEEPAFERSTDIDDVEEPRIKTKIASLDRVLSGGATLGTVFLLGGKPGIGKSTLLAQMLHGLSKQGLTSLYTSGEETKRQVATRFRRLRCKSENVFIAASSRLDEILAIAREVEPVCLVIDCVQSTYDPEVNGSTGSVTQCRSVTQKIVEFTRNPGFEDPDHPGLVTFLVCRATKDDKLAGPRDLEHLVDTPLSFEEPVTEPGVESDLCVLRVLKNRHGRSRISTVFRMTDKGLVEEDPADGGTSKKAPASSSRRKRDGGRKRRLKE